MEGQLRGILRMMEEEKDCKEIITQLSAVRSGVDRTIGIIVTNNLINCLGDSNKDEGEVNLLVKEATDLIIKSR